MKPEEILMEEQQEHGYYADPEVEGVEEYEDETH